MQLPFPLPELTLPAEVHRALPAQHRIYCNRSLRLDQIQWIGFDMDYTLAIYDQPEMDRLSIEATVRKMVDRGYPDDLLHMEYRTDFPIRGLLIDKKLGNVLKMDRYKYVKRAYHGMRELTREERRTLYHTRRLRSGTKRYHWVDTLYALCEVAVFAAAIDVLEQRGMTVDYEQLFTDVRACIDLAHQDGSILDVVVLDLPRFVKRDPELGPTLHKLRSAGKRLFLLTNSRPAYTEKMMSYLVDGQLPEYPSWRNYFDVVICAARKPLFFKEESPFEEVLPNGTRPATTLERGRIYTGGNIVEFDRILQVPHDNVLYVGDHIYGDVLRAKKETAWRTAMIIQEMDDELSAIDRSSAEITRLDQLEDALDRLNDELREHQLRLKTIQRRIDQLAETGHAAPPDLDAARVRHRRAIDKLRAKIKAATTEHDALEDRIDASFHPFWGSLFKAGPEVSSFGDQVEAYACLYTTRVSNLLRYSPVHYFRSARDRMPHEAVPPGGDASADEAADAPPVARDPAAQ